MNSVFLLVTKSSFACPFWLAIIGKNFIKLGECRLIQLCTVFTNIIRRIILLLISFDRLLIVSFPLIFGRKPMFFFFILMAIAGVYSGILTALMWLSINQPDIYDRKVTCVVSDMSNNIGHVGTFVTSSLLVFAALAAVTYLLILAIFKWKRDKSEEEKVTETSTITKMDLSPHHRKLPAELNQQIYLCFNSTNQRKFIWGLGWDFYAMFRHRLLIKIKRICNPPGNHWKRTNTTATITADGLNFSNNVGYTNVYAEKGFHISVPHCRVDEFPGTICYYYEVKGDMWLNIGLSDCHDPFRFGGFYAILTSGNDNYYYDCWLGGETHYFQSPEGAVRPRKKKYGNVFGCGLVLGADEKLWIFFTLNGWLMGRKIRISPAVDRLFPAVTMMSLVSYIEANFGDDPAKPFEYDIKNCPRLGLACI